MRYLLFIASLLLFFSCRNDRLKIDVSGIDAEINITRTEIMLFEKDSLRFLANCEELKTKHCDFFNAYGYYVLDIGPADHPEFESNLNLFIKDSVYARVADSVMGLFHDFSPYEKRLRNGFKHLAWYFPDLPFFQVYTCVSGFNESVFTTGNTIGISLDNYLGADCIFYRYLGISRYKSQKMYPLKMVPDLFYSLFLTLFPFREPVDHLLANMIYQGKALYFTQAMSPSLPDTVLTGFTLQQARWCMENEEAMWTYLAERRLLYDTERLTIQKYTGDAPFTNTFSDQSPGRTGVWLGWRIVGAFMNNNPEISLRSMIEEYDAQAILSQSGYNPQ